MAGYLDKEVVLKFALKTKARYEDDTSAADVLESLKVGIENGEFDATFPLLFPAWEVKFKEQREELDRIQKCNSGLRAQVRDLEQEISQLKTQTVSCVRDKVVVENRDLHEKIALLAAELDRKNVAGSMQAAELFKESQEVIRLRKELRRANDQHLEEEREIRQLHEKLGQKCPISGYAGCCRIMEERDELRSRVVYLERSSNVQKKQQAQENDPWKNRSAGMRCRTCMYFAVKTTTTSESKAQYAAGQIALAGKYGQIVGRCRRHAPTMNGYPVVFEDDWCGDHKIDETKV
ncbi:MAG: hypothetical protein ABFC78_09765 [Methanoregula sp.]|jgi:DNA repair exonuclease SbcCD ATPase subunit